VSGCKKKEPPPNAPVPAEAPQPEPPEIPRAKLPPELKELLEKMDVPGLKPGEVPDVAALTKDIPGGTEAAQKIAALFAHIPEDVEAWLKLLNELTGDPAETIKRGKRFAVTKAMGYLASASKPDCGPFQVLKTPAVVNGVIVKSFIDLRARLEEVKGRVAALKGKFAAFDKEIKSQYRLLSTGPVAAFAKCIPR
jgi:hypothetical protein